MEKIPDSILFKLEREENGKLKAYIDELEYVIKKQEERSESEKAMFKKAEYSLQLKAQLKAEQKRYKDLRTKYKDLQHKLYLTPKN